MSSAQTQSVRPRLAPKWAVIYAAFTVVLITAFTVVGYVQPGLLIGTWNAIDAPGATDLDGPLGLWMARNIAFIGFAVFALALRSQDMIIGVLIFRAFADLFDFVHWGLVAGNLVNGLAPSRWQSSPPSARPSCCATATSQNEAEAARPSDVRCFCLRFRFRFRFRFRP